MRPGPQQNPSDLILCSNMEVFILYTNSLLPSDVDRLIKMAKNRASRGARLELVIVVNLSGRKQIEEVFAVHGSDDSGGFVGNRSVVSLLVSLNVMLHVSS